jgi:hypothetical protein
LNFRRLERGGFFFSLMNSAPAPATWRYWPRSAALSRVNFFTSGWQNFPTELFHERAGRRQIRKTPAKIDFAFSNNSPSMANLNFSRPVKVHYPAAQFDVQFVINDGKPNDVGKFTLAYDHFFGGPSAHRRPSSD